MSITVMGQVMIIVNDPQIAVNLLDKAGSELSDRPVLPMASLCGWDRVLSAARAGPRYLSLMMFHSVWLTAICALPGFVRFASSLAG